MPMAFGRPIRTVPDRRATRSLAWPLPRWIYERADTRHGERCTALDMMQGLMAAIFKGFLRMDDRAAPETLAPDSYHIGDAPLPSGSASPRAICWPHPATGIDGFDHHYNTALAALRRPRRSGAGAFRGMAGAHRRDVRDLSGPARRIQPGKPIWLTETADAACGGNRWTRCFMETFRYLDQHGRLARAGVQVVMHNTLAASDYGLLDEGRLDPRGRTTGLRCSVVG